ncbi:hypothetical protein SHLI107390_00105 [Shewanella livingstonensis]
MDNECFQKSNVLRVTISPIAGVYRLVFTRRSYYGTHNVHTIGKTTFPTYEEARYNATAL